MAPAERMTSPLPSHLQPLDMPVLELRLDDYARRHCRDLGFRTIGDIAKLTLIELDSKMVKRNGLAGILIALAKAGVPLADGTFLTCPVRIDDYWQH